MDQSDTNKYDEAVDSQWLEMFGGIEDDLSKCLVLVATLRTRRLISIKESLMMKRSLMYGTTQAAT